MDAMKLLIYALFFGSYIACMACTPSDNSAAGRMRACGAMCGGHVAVFVDGTPTTCICATGSATPAPVPQQVEAPK